MDSEDCIKFINGIKEDGGWLLLDHGDVMHVGEAVTGCTIEVGFHVGLELDVSAGSYGFKHFHGVWGDTLDVGVIHE